MRSRPASFLAWLQIALIAGATGNADEALPEVEPSVLRGWHSSIRDESGRQYDFVSPHAQPPHAATARATDGAMAPMPRFKVITLQRGEDAAEGDANLVARVVLEGGESSAEGVDDDEELRRILSAALGAEHANLLLAAAGMKERAHPALPALEPDVPLSSVLNAIGESLGELGFATQRMADSEHAGLGQPTADSPSERASARAVSTNELVRDVQLHAKANQDTGRPQGVYAGRSSVEGAPGEQGSAVKEPLVRAALRTPTPPAEAIASRASTSMAGGGQAAAAPAESAPHKGEQDGRPSTSSFGRLLAGAGEETLQLLELELRSQLAVVESKVRRAARRVTRVHACMHPLYEGQCGGICGGQAAGCWCCEHSSPDPHPSPSPVRAPLGTRSSCVPVSAASGRGEARSARA